MAKLILKSPYIDCAERSGSRYLQYIATRERVEILPDDRPPTKKQQQLIRKILTDFPDSKELSEYKTYRNRPTKFFASALIAAAMECNPAKAAQSDVYMQYIATRPRVQRMGEHGLFGDADNVDLGQAVSELEHYTGRVWTHIISLKRGDAERLGYDCAAAWRDLLRMHRSDIAAAMKIPARNFRWYAAFHDEGDHPHVHMMAWSADPKEGYLDQNGIRSIRSKLTNEIFRQELYSLYEEKSQTRDALVRQARQELKQAIRTVQAGVFDHPEAEQLMLKLSQQLSAVQGKKVYSYLPKPVKETVNGIVDQLEEIPAVKQCYEKWQLLQSAANEMYTDIRRNPKKLSEEKEFRSVKNAVIRAALELHNLTFEDAGIGTADETENRNEISRSAWKWGKIAGDDSAPFEKRRAAMREVASLAKQGDAWAKYIFACLYRDSNLVTPDSTKAKLAFQDAAESGLAAAQVALGKLCFSDDPDVHDPEAGRRWLERAAEGGSSYAAYILAKEYLTGRNLPRDAKRAEQLLGRAAKQGSAYAQYTLGKLLLTGTELPQDTQRAEHWLRQAAEQGNPYAQRMLERVQNPPAAEAFLAVTNLVQQIAKTFESRSLPKSSTGGMKIDKKRLRQLREKRMAMGHAEDDHPDAAMQMG